MKTIHLRGLSHTYTSPRHRFDLPIVIVKFLGLLLAHRPALAVVNFTVENTDISINYSGDWQELPGALEHGRPYKLTEDPQATAAFVFNGTAIYYFSPLWPFPITTDISIDGDKPDTLFLQDPASVSAPDPSGKETVASAIVWARTGLLNTRHTLVMSPGLNGSSFVMVDKMIYTAQDIILGPSISTTSHALDITSSQPTPSTSAISAGAQVPHHNKTGLIIVVAITCTALGLIVLYVLRWVWIRRTCGVADSDTSTTRSISDHNGTLGMAEASAETPIRGSIRRVYSIPPERHSVVSCLENPFKTPPPSVLGHSQDQHSTSGAVMDEEEDREREREQERERKQKWCQEYLASGRLGTWEG